MGTFFQDLLETESYKVGPKRWAELLDWLALDEKCLKKSDTKIFLQSLGEAYDAISWETKKDATDWSKRRIGKIQFVSQFKTFHNIIKHIRNILFHGRAEIVQESGALMIEGQDFGKRSGEKTQTAYIWMPLDFLMEIFDIYQKIENGNKTAQKEGGNER